MAMASGTSTERFGTSTALPEADHRATLAPASAVSWGAILAGATAAAALSLILLILGTGLGLSSVSPWAHSGLGAEAIGMSTIVWLTLTQLMASGMGGYLAGRLRSRWLAVHSDEVYFRDTAHGFLAWALATLATAALLGSVVTAMVGSGMQAGTGLAGGAAAAAAGSNKPDSRIAVSAYLVDRLLRTDMPAVPAVPAAPSDGTAVGTPATTAAEPSTTHHSAALAAPGAGLPGAAAGEITRILANAQRSSGAMPADDTRHLAVLVARHTGLTPSDAEKRVIDTVARLQAEVTDADNSARTAADAARKASAATALWLFVSLLFGAFFASLAATMGGRQRDA